MDKTSVMLKKLLLAAGLALATVLPVHAADDLFPPGGMANVTILPGWRTERGTHMAALRIQLAPGWKTYWRAPGEGGFPPRFDWSGSRNLKGVAFHWPLPAVFDQNGMRSVGYKDELILPMELTPEAAGRSISLRAAVELGVCLDICIPMQVSVAAILGRAGQADPRIRAAIRNRPMTGREAGVTGVSCRIEPIADGLRLTATLALPPLGDREATVIEHPNQRVWVSEPTIERRGNLLVAVSDLVGPTNKPFSLDRSQLRFTVLSKGRGVDIRGCSG